MQQGVRSNKRNQELNRFYAEIALKQEENIRWTEKTFNDFMEKKEMCELQIKNVCIKVIGEIQEN